MVYGTPTNQRSQPGVDSPAVPTRWASAQKATPSFQHAESGLGDAALQRSVPAALAPYGDVAAAATQDQRFRARTPPARRTGRAIHEQLIERGRLYEQRKEALQEKAKLREVSRCRSVPKVSPPAKALVRNEPIVQRLYKIENEKRKMAEFRQMEADQREAKQFAQLFKPRISNRGQRAQRRSMGQQHQLWEFKREQRIHEQRLAQIARDMAEVHDTPVINQRSETLAERKRQADGLDGYSYLEGMMERDRLAQQQKWERTQQLARADAPFTPRITALAATMKSDMDVADRLTLHGQYREEKLRRAAAERAAQAFAEEQQGGGAAQVPPPPPSSSSSHHQQHHRGDGSMYDRAMEHVRRRDARLDQQREAERRRHTPALDTESLAIAGRLEQTPQERLLRPRSPAPSSATPRASTPPASMASPSFQQQQRRGPTNMTTPNTLIERMDHAERQRQRRLERAREEQEMREAADLTFTPKLSIGTRYVATGAGAPDPTASPAAPSTYAQRQQQDLAEQRHTSYSASPTAQRLYERTTQWAKQRDARREAERDRLEAEEEAQLQQYHYNQQQQQQQQQRSEHGAAGGASGDSRAPGFESHVARNQDGRALRERRDAADPHFRGAGNSSGVGGPPHPPPGPTVPQPFELGKRPAVAGVASLQPPVQPSSQYTQRLFDEEVQDGGADGEDHRRAPPSHHHHHHHHQTTPLRTDVYYYGSDAAAASSPPSSDTARRLAASLFGSGAAAASASSSAPVRPPEGSRGRLVADEADAPSSMYPPRPSPGRVSGYQQQHYAHHHHTSSNASGGGSSPTPNAAILGDLPANLSDTESLL